MSAGANPLLYRFGDEFDLYQSPNGVQLLPKIDLITGIAKSF